MSWRFIISVTIFMLMCNQANAQELPFTHYTPDREINPLPSAMVTHVYQDQQGFIWMSVFSSGLVRFDGIRMDLYDHRDGLGDPGIWKTAEDSNGYLWITSNSGLFVSKEPLTNYQYGRRIQFTSELEDIQLYRDALSENQFTADDDGNVWIAASGYGIIQYRMENQALITDTTSTDIDNNGNESVISLLALNDQSVIAGISGGYLIRIQNEELSILYEPAEVSVNRNFISLYEDRDGKVWAYRQNGEILLFEDLQQSPRTIHQGQPSNIASITTIADSTIWASNGTTGIIKFDMNSADIIDTYTRKNGLLSDNAIQVLEDREKNVWIAQSGGVSRLRFNYRAFENYSALSMAGETPSLPSARVNAVHVSDNASSPCKVWVGTEGGLTCIHENKSTQFITQDDGLLGDWVNGLAGQDSEILWIATTQGLNGITFNGEIPFENAVDIRNIELFDTQATLFSIEDSPPFIAAENLDIYNNQTGNYISGSWFPGLRSIFAVVGSEIFEFDTESGLPSTLYKSVAFDQDGHLWIGTLDRGIYRSQERITVENLPRNGIHDVTFSSFWSRSEDAPTNHIEKMRWFDGKMWIGTQEGLFVINAETAEIENHISTNDGLLANNAVSFAISPVTNHLWIGTNRGLSEYDPSTGQVLKTVMRLDGLIDNEVWLYGSVQADQQGLIYYGTANGLSIYHPGLDRPNTVPPALHLNQAEISYQAEGRNEVTFEYTALSFATHAGIRYRTRLLGYNNNWSPETSETRLRYTNLPALFVPKEYTLEVIAINESGIPSEESLHFTFLVNPVWWLQWWAFLVYFLIFSAGVFVVDRIQRSRLIKKERDAAKLREAKLQAETALERSKVSEAETKALQAENERKALELEKARELEKAYHELKSAQNQLVQAEKMASLGRLSAGIAHEIKNPLNFINNFANLSTELVEELMEAIRIQDKEEVDYILGNLKFNTSKIEEHGKRADSIVRSMMQHARGGKSTFEDFDLNSLVEKYVDLAYHGKRAQISDFFTKITTDFSPKVGNVKVVGQEIGQVLLNIIGNSLDAVWEHKNNQDSDDFTPEIIISTHRLNNSVEIRISDNGPGVPDEIREKIFEPFFTTKPTGEGTGLGLSLSYDIITLGHNGSLKLENRDGYGATFVITLPGSGYSVNE